MIAKTPFRPVFALWHAVQSTYYVQPNAFGTVSRQCFGHIFKVGSRSSGAACVCSVLCCRSYLRSPVTFFLLMFDEPPLGPLACMHGEHSNSCVLSMFVYNPEIDTFLSERFAEYFQASPIVRCSSRWS